MATVVAIAYRDEDTAEQARATVWQLEDELIIELDQVAVISRDPHGDYERPHQPQRPDERSDRDRISRRSAARRAPARLADAVEKGWVDVADVVSSPATMTAGYVRF